MSAYFATGDGWILVGIVVLLAVCGLALHGTFSRHTGQHRRTKPNPVAPLWRTLTAPLVARQAAVDRAAGREAHA